MAVNREYTRVILTMCCIAALVLSAVTLPVISDGPVGSGTGSGQSGDGQAGDGVPTSSPSEEVDQSVVTATGESADSDGQGGGSRGDGGEGTGDGDGDSNGDGVQTGSSSAGDQGTLTAGGSADPDGQRGTGEGEGAEGSSSGDQLTSGPGQSGEGGSQTPRDSGSESDGTQSTVSDRESGSDGQSSGQESESDSQSSGQESESDSQSSGQESGSDAQPSGQESESDGQSSGQESESDAQPSDQEPESDEDSNTRNEPSEEDAVQPLEFELNRSELIPGTDVQVTTTRNDDPVAGITVLFNGERVGTTDQDGIVVGTIPYTAELNVTAAPGSNARSVGGPAVLASRSHFNIRAPSIDALSAPGSEAPRRADVETYPVQTNATVEITEPPVPDSPVTITATINGTPLPGGAVTVGGANVTETNQSGQARVTLPADVQRTRLRVTRGDVVGEREVSLVTRLNVSVQGEFHPQGDAQVTVTARGRTVNNATVTVGEHVLGRTAETGTATGQFPETTGNVAVTVTKGVAEGTQSLTLKQLTIRTTPQHGVAFPWTDIRIQSELENESVGGVAVQMNGRPLGETGADGTLRATFPPTYGVTVTAIGYGQRVSTTAGNPLLLFVGTLVMSLLLVGGAVRRKRRSERTVRGSVTSVLGLGRRAVLYLFGGIVSLASKADNLLRVMIRAFRVLRADIAAIPQVLRRWIQRTYQKLTDLFEWFKRTVRRVTTWVVGVAQRTATIVRNPKQSLYAFIGWFQRRTASDGSDTGAKTTDGSAMISEAQGGDAEQESRLTVREAWREFLGYVSVRRWQTKTPGQISRRAINADELPPDAVKLLTNSFRDVEYGDRSAQEKVAGTREALESIKHAVHGDGEEDNE